MTETGRFEVRVTADSHMAWLRTRLALERTMMACLRTAIALIACGLLTLLIAIWQYHWTVRYMWSAAFAPIAGMTKEGLQSPILAVAALLVLIGLFAFVAVLLRLV